MVVRSGPVDQRIRHHAVQGRAEQGAQQAAIIGLWEHRRERSPLLGQSCGAGETGGGPSVIIDTCIRGAGRKGTTRPPLAFRLFTARSKSSDRRYKASNLVQSLLGIHLNRQQKYLIHTSSIMRASIFVPVFAAAVLAQEVSWPSQILSSLHRCLQGLD